MSIDVEEVRRQHTSTRMKRCRWCSEQWPCTPLQMAGEIEALRKLTRQCGTASWADDICVLPPEHQNFHASAKGVCWPVFDRSPDAPAPGAAS